MIQTICHLIASREHGGLEKHVADLSRWQVHNTGARVAVIAHPRYLTTLDERIQFIPLNTDRSRHHPNLVWRLASVIRKGGYQIVHGHGSKSAQLLAAVQPFTETRQVITRHNVRHPRDKLASAFDARIAISHNTVANSKLEWTIIPNGVELSAPATSAPVPELDATGGPTLLVASRLIKARCVDQLIAALPLLPDARLVVLGDGPEKEALQQQASNLQLDARVVFFAGNNAVANFMQAADLVIIPAVAEGTPYTLLEALLHRTPVIANGSGNVIDYLPQKYLLSEIAPAHIAEKIRATLQSTTLEKDFAPLFARAQSEFTLDSMARATWQVYAGLMA
ncbi:glycosyltransferase family 4 protein [Microbulbifer pacificus]|uniref:Glycosyltransferase family 4 protein n=1 Tax=Microbulbifer pacificus TaxID=407164 RepID=A0AAU0MZC4_9GAMM|nr:glycosyltransferase family 4 protein [Microbulbifer pacificus]WOX06005.1 glycosyltransferase family 4 protein [Microbulbifer pacificus]